MNETQPTAAEKIPAPPVITRAAEDVVLPYLRDEDGNPVVVRVTPLDEWELLNVTARAPGYWPPDLASAPKTGNESNPFLASWEAIRPFAPGLIAATCTPKFGEGGLPLEYLRETEQCALAVAALRASGQIGGPAEQVARFPGVDGGSAAGPRNGGSA